MNRVLTFMIVGTLVVSCGSKKPATAADATKAPAPAPAVTAVPSVAPVNQSPPQPAVETKQEVTPEPKVESLSPTQVIERYTEELRGIVDLDQRTEKGKRDPEREKRIADKVRQFFDFEGLARMSLGRHWAKVTETQRREYKDLFIGLVEDSYLRRSRDLVGKYKIIYGKETVSGNRSKVTSRVVRNDADVELSYELHRNPQNWMIFNIVLDGVDLIRNYQTQFNRIIEQNGFSDLLKRMRKKRSEAEDDNGL